MNETEQARTVQYDVLIDRLIPDFKPARLLWPVGSRLAIWLLLEASIIALLVFLRWNSELIVQLESVRYLFELGTFILIGIATANLALRTAIPGREATRDELLFVSAAALVAIGLVASEPMQTDVALGQFIRSGMTLLLYTLSLAAVPWVVLFQAVRRGVPLQPGLSGGFAGAAAFSFAFVGAHLIWPVNDSLLLLTWQIVPIGFAILLSALAGMALLNPAKLWRRRAETAPSGYDREPFIGWAWQQKWVLDRALFPAALSAAMVLLVTFLHGQHQLGAQVPDFDLAIESYGHSLVDFHPNVPSDSLGTVLKAYIEHGMPAYMWDFSPEGYKLVGGRVEMLPDGSPITYTMFRGNAGSIFCLIRATEGFNPPAGMYEQRRNYLFYSYRGYSVCLSNVGNYGSYVCVLVSRLPMKDFMHAVLAVAP